LPTPLRKNFVAYLLLGPLALFLLLVLGYPLVANIVYSLSDVEFQTIRNPGWLGLGNYSEVLGDRAFWNALGFSLRFALWAAGLEVLLGLGLALAFEPVLNRRGPLLALLLLPMMISPALLGIMYRLILNDFVGLVPQWLQMAGIFINLLTPPHVVGTLIGIEVLQWTPFALLLIYTALQAIPHELVEAARIDGAGGAQILRSITIPLLVPALAIAGFVRFVDSFRVFDHIYVLTGGGPGTLTTSISIYIYRQFFQQAELGQAIAASMLLLLLSLIPLYISMRFILRGSR
jgi:multiple sugar transport system permease protein